VLRTLIGAGVHRTPGRRPEGGGVVVVGGRAAGLEVGDGVVGEGGGGGALGAGRGWPASVEAEPVARQAAAAAAKAD
jgi:hypothetical protein